MTPQSTRLRNIVETIDDIDTHPASPESARDLRRLEEELLDVAARVAELEQRAAGDEMPIVFSDDYASVLARAAMAERREFELHAENSRLRTMENDAIRVAEKRAKQVWAALMHVVQSNARIVDIEAVPEHFDELAIVARSSTNGTTQTLLTSHAPQHTRLAILVPSSPLNPDLLERRGTELIEAGEKLLAEYQRQKAAEKVPEPIVGNTTCTRCKRWMRTPERVLADIPGRLHLDLATQCVECRP